MVDTVEREREREREKGWMIRGKRRAAMNTIQLTFILVSCGNNGNMKIDYNIRAFPYGSTLYSVLCIHITVPLSYNTVYS
ncbi:hypothetical protein VN97_g11959 [Penicillium thymicola]|uniref:Uncharacterized protein n=1 Tax=Penicillium thymicola TaxID=293382 RepID=A0AAI9X300_PENTH|nr:hypothetical protein VN97_g11959 [Penicillium thymicola]